MKHSNTIQKALLFVVNLLTSFIATAQPVVSSLSAAYGDPGSAITITGSGFNTTPANNIVYFGSTRASVTAASTTSLTLTVPASATHKPVSVNNTSSSLTGYSQYPFLPTFSSSAYVPGNIHFDSRLDFSASGPILVKFGDLDGDGKPEMVVSIFAMNMVSVYRNMSTTGAITTGSFSAPVNISVLSSSDQHGLELADIDGDGKLDIVITILPGFFYVLRNTYTTGTLTTGSFAAPVGFNVMGLSYGTRVLHIGDLDGDGKPDVIINGAGNGKVIVFRNTSTAGSVTTGSFAAPVAYHVSSPGSYGIALGDIDGDGKTDVVASGDSLYVLRNTSVSGSISMATKVGFELNGVCTKVTVADFNTDGKLDVACISGSSGFSGFSVLRNTATPGTIGPGSFAPKANIEAGFVSGGAIITGDLDGDHKPDLAITDATHDSVVVIRNKVTGLTIDTGSFARRKAYRVGGNATDIAICDIDGDGKPELVIANNGSNSVSVLRNNPLYMITGSSSVCVSATTALTDSTLGGTWSSSDPAIATVGASTGIVTGITAGTATISYAALSGVATMTITVSPPPTPVTGIMSMTVGATTTLASTPSGGSWSSSNTAVATVGFSSGIVTGVSVGTATITYAISASCYATATVSVNPAVSLSAGFLNSQNGHYIEVYPNPTNDKLFLRWILAKPEFANVTISDITGRSLYAFSAELNAGPSQTQIELPELKNGIYLIAIRSETINYSSKLMIQK